MCVCACLWLCSCVACNATGIITKSERAHTQTTHMNWMMNGKNKSHSLNCTSMCSVYDVRMHACRHAKKLSLTPINIRIRMSAFHVFSNNFSTIKHMFLIHIISFVTLASLYIVIQKARERNRDLIYHIVCIFCCDSVRLSAIRSPSLLLCAVEFIFYS